MSDAPLPSYFVAPLPWENSTGWRIMRSGDGGSCGIDPLPHQGAFPVIREFTTETAATEYIKRLEQGTAGTNGDPPVRWVQPVAGVDRPHGPPVEGWSYD